MEEWGTTTTINAITSTITVIPTTFLRNMLKES